MDSCSRRQCLIDYSIIRGSILKYRSSIRNKDCEKSKRKYQLNEKLLVLGKDNARILFSGKRLSFLNIPHMQILREACLRIDICLSQFKRKHCLLVYYEKNYKLHFRKSLSYNR